MAAQEVVYLVHLERPICPGRPAQHYLGYTANLEQRIAKHLNGTGSAMLRVANQRGIKWEVVATWPVNRGGEVQFKRRRNHKKLCPLCTPPKVRAKPPQTSPLTPGP